MPAALGGYVAWSDVKHLFVNDDGSLPDIFIQNLSRQEMIKVYAWVRTLAEVYNDPYVWSVAESKELKVHELSRNPVELFLEGSIEGFRHGLVEFEYAGTTVPQLSIAVFEESALEFDYRMGKNWGPEQAVALFRFLARIQLMAPNCRITRADEGEPNTRCPEFEEELSSYVVAT